MGVTRSARLPRAIDGWFEARLAVRTNCSPSELLVELVYGGLRLREGYMAIHRRTLEGFATSGQGNSYAIYRHCLVDTFGAAYVDHLERWLEADGIVPARTHAPPD